MENATRVGWFDMKVGDGEVTWSSVGGQVGVHRSPEQSDLLRERSKRFLALHLIFGIFVLGISLVFLWLLLNFSQLFTPLAETTVLPRYCCTIPLPDEVKEDTTAC